VVTVSFNLDDYEPVEVRVEKFWADHKAGRILTTLEQTGDASYIVSAHVYRNAEDERPAATGWAQENVTPKGVNSTSALENCETSAIGRALANLGYAAKGKRPSREEMEKAERGSPDPRMQLFTHIREAGAKRGMEPSDLEADYAATHDGRSIREASAADLALYHDTLTHPPKEETADAKRAPANASGGRSSRTATRRSTIAATGAHTAGNGESREVVPGESDAS
jgi:hypothetical protein